MLRHGELPAGLTPVLEVQRRRLPFRAGEPIRYRETKVERYRIVDYLHAIDVRLDDITEVHLHGARDSAIVLTREDLRHHADDLLFKFAGETFGKPIPVIRNVDVGTSFDDLRALSIYVKRTPPHLTTAQTLELDGRPVRGIPYHGEPMREGVRVYVDGRLATVLKRNQLEATGARSWRLAEVLARGGVAVDRIDRMALVHDEAQGVAHAWQDLELTFDPGKSGEIKLGPDGQPANAIALFTRPASPS
jgi:hypothetical protein